jgi:hypothetical protein
MLLSGETKVGEGFFVEGCALHDSLEASSSPSRREVGKGMSGQAKEIMVQLSHRRAPSTAALYSK